MWPPRCIVILRGPRDASREQARPWLRPGWRWFGPGEEPLSSLRRALGQTVDGLVLDFHDGLDPEALGRAHGLVRAGGTLVLLAPSTWPAPPLAVPPFVASDVATRFEARFDRVVERHPDAFATTPRRASRAIAGDQAEQDAAVARLIAFTRGPLGSIALIADRGRGKSAALGRALREAPGVVVTGPSRDALTEVERFGGALPFVEPSALLQGPPPPAVFVDEAAQLPVPLLRELAGRVPTRWVFATTVHGYEGTGRGFALRFLPWLAEAMPLERIELHTPIRWAPDDPVERFVFDALLLDSQPSAGRIAPPPPRRVGRDALAGDEPRLRALFGLLVQAHYRTTPSDLQRILDAPNLHLHTLESESDVLGVNLVAEEGGLEPGPCETLLAGGNVRGHALPQTLLTHLQRPESGPLRFVRSVRIATHPDRRGEGLARRLVAHVHAAYRPDAFGTIFGATADLVRFRQSLGYEVVRISASRGARTGEAAVTMLRPVSPPAARLVGELRGDLARLLPLQLELLAADGWLVDEALALALADGLPPARELGPEETRRRLEGYIRGPQTFEAAADVVTALVGGGDRTPLSESDQRLLEARVLERRSWREATARAGLPSPRAAMRALRRAVRALAG